MKAVPSHSIVLIGRREILLLRNENLGDSHIRVGKWRDCSVPSTRWRVPISGVPSRSNILTLRKRLRITGTSGQAYLAEILIIMPGVLVSVRRPTYSSRWKV